MLKKYVYSYIKNLKYDDMVKFINKENIFLSDSEYQFLFEYTKKNWELLFTNRDKIFKDLKASLNSITYSKIEPILLMYQEKYKSYL
jgi:hypothetical protein